MFDYCSSSCCFYFVSLCYHEKPQYTGVYLLLNDHLYKPPSLGNTVQHIDSYIYINGQAISRGRRGSDRMVFVCTATYATGAYSMYLS